MKKLSLCLVLTFAVRFVLAQTFPSEIWHDGRLVLLEGDTLKGQVKYDLESDLIQFTENKETIKTYTGRKLLYFEIFDETVNRYRQFYAIPYNLQGDYKTPIIFEVLVTGEHLSLLSREALEHQVVNYPYAMSGTYSRLQLVYTHYLLKPDGSITEFTGRRRDLLRIMDKRSGEMKKFIKSNKLRVDNRSDLVKAVINYNSLFN